MSEKGNPPVHTERDGLLSVGIWINETEKGPKTSYRLQKAYETEDGGLKNTYYLSAYDLPRAEKLFDRAYNVGREILEDFKRTQAAQQQQTAEVEAPAQNQARVYKYKPK